MSELSARVSGPDEFQRIFSVSRETVERLKVYEGVLKTWQKTINLVAPSTLGEIWHRHFADSAQVFRFAPDDTNVLFDFGSGGGFPGLVAAILLAERGLGRVTLVESDTRKAAFLGEVARKTGIAVEIRSERIEKVAIQAKSQKVDVISARALAPLGRLFELTGPFFGPESVALFLKGRDVASEIQEAEAAGWQFDCTLQPSLTDADARVAVIRNLHVRTEG